MLLLICITPREWMIEASVFSTGEDSSDGVHLSGQREVSKKEIQEMRSWFLVRGGKKMSENGEKMQVTGSTWNLQMSSSVSPQVQTQEIFNVMIEKKQMLTSGILEP